MADAAMRNEISQSSAGGEQPKFTIREKKQDGSITHWLIKFSPPANTPSGIRWADLLICKHIAAGHGRHRHHPPRADTA